MIHPPYNTPIDRDRRWVTLIERAAALHADVRLSMRLPPPFTCSAPSTRAWAPAPLTTKRRSALIVDNGR